MFSKNYWIVPVKYQKLYTLSLVLCYGVPVFVARGLAPVGWRSRSRACTTKNYIRSFCDCCAAERGQAPSPQCSPCLYLVLYNKSHDWRAAPWTTSYSLFLLRTSPGKSSALPNALPSTAATGWKAACRAWRGNSPGFCGWACRPRPTMNWSRPCRACPPKAFACWSPKAASNNPAPGSRSPWNWWEMIVRGSCVTSHAC
ncbi:hypothetical protein D9M69_546690 [compost metagenome]